MALRAGGLKTIKLPSAHPGLQVETIGDCYMVAGGLIRKDEEGFASVHCPGAVDPLHAVRVMSFAKVGGLRDWGR